jgi:hypothetical protein
MVRGVLPVHRPGVSALQDESCVKITDIIMHGTTFSGG